MMAQVRAKFSRCQAHVGRKWQHAFGPKLVDPGRIRQQNSARNRSISAQIWSTWQATLRRVSPKFGLIWPESGRNVGPVSANFESDVAKTGRCRPDLARFGPTSTCSPRTCVRPSSGDLCLRKDLSLLEPLRTVCPRSPSREKAPPDQSQTMCFFHVSGQWSSSPNCALNRLFADFARVVAGPSQCSANRLPRATLPPAL